MDKKEFDTMTQVVRDYFEKDLAAIDAEITKTDDLISLMNDTIGLVKNDAQRRGPTVALAENMKALITAYNQKQSLIKDRVSLKKTIMDASHKFARPESGDTDSGTMRMLLENFRTGAGNVMPTTTQTDKSTEEIDADIMRALNESEEV